jgi:hypothetical protein
MEAGLLGDNRVTRAFRDVQGKFELLSSLQRTELDANMAVTFEEHFAFQQTQAWAHAAGIITPDEAWVFYSALGEIWNMENGGWAAETDTVTKCVVTVLIGQLLARRQEEAERDGA